MIALRPELKVVVAAQPVDFRKSLHTLSALVSEALRANPYCGDVFVFRSKRADRVKLLAWDGSGMVLVTKWLHQGHFTWPPIRDGVVHLSATQLAMLLDGLEWTRVSPKPVKQPAGKPRKKARRNIGALPKHLPRCEQVLEPDTTACPCCEGRLHKIGEDVSEVLDVIPAILRVLRTIRPKYACRGCTDGVVQAKVLPRLIESGKASAAPVTHVVVPKFAWYLPLYRQGGILAGPGGHLDRPPLAGRGGSAARWVPRVYELRLRTRPGA